MKKRGQTISLVALALALTLFATSVSALPKEVKAEGAPQRRTDISFSGSNLGGKYQVPGEGIATVENEKSLINLIEPRREFTDRLRKAVTRR